jgi:hypothetical protein
MESEPRRMGGKGSAVQLGGERQEPNNNLRETQPALDAIGTFMPWIGKEERALRKRLHNAWTIASARASRSDSGNARTLYWTAALVASEWTFARSDLEDLKDIADALVRLFLAAGTLERVEGSVA